MHMILNAVDVARMARQPAHGPCQVFMQPRAPGLDDPGIAVLGRKDQMIVQTEIRTTHGEGILTSARGFVEVKQTVSAEPSLPERRQALCPGGATERSQGWRSEPPPLDRHAKKTFAPRQGCQTFDACGRPA